MAEKVPIKATVPVSIEGAVEVEGKIPAAEAAKEQALKTQGQRNINEKWESTQQWTAILVTCATMAACLVMIVCGLLYNKVEFVVSAFLFMSNNCTQVITAYFTRTNHTKTGGVGGTDSSSR